MPAELMALGHPVLAWRFIVVAVARMFVYFTFDPKYVGIVSFDFNKGFRGSGDPANSCH